MPKHPFTEYFVNGVLWEDTSVRKYANKKDADSTAAHYRKIRPDRQYKVYYDYESNEYLVLRRKPKDLFEARIYRGDERVDTRDVEALTPEEAEVIVRKTLVNPATTYDVEIVRKYEASL